MLNNSNFPVFLIFITHLCIESSACYDQPGYGPAKTEQLSQPNNYFPTMMPEYQRWIHENPSRKPACTSGKASVWLERLLRDVEDESETEAPSAVIEWPHDVAMRRGEIRRIPFTFSPRANFDHATISKEDDYYTHDYYNVFSVRKDQQAELRNRMFFELVPDKPYDLAVRAPAENLVELTGIYQVRVTYNHTRSDEQREFEIAVYDDAQCYSRSSNMMQASYVSAGETVNLTCFVRVDGYLVPNVEWTDCAGNKIPPVKPKKVSEYAYETYIFQTAQVTASSAHASCNFTCRVTFADDPEATATECNTAFRMKSVVDSEGPIVSEWPEDELFIDETNPIINFTFNNNASYLRAEIAKVSDPNTPSVWETTIFYANQTHTSIPYDYATDYELVPGSKYSIRIIDMDRTKGGYYVARLIDSQHRVEQKYFHIGGYAGPWCENFYTTSGAGYEVGKNAGLKCNLINYKTEKPVITWRDCRGQQLPGKFWRSDQYVVTFDTTLNHSFCPFTCEAKFKVGGSLRNVGSCDVQFEVRSLVPRCNARSEDTPTGGNFLQLDCFTKAKTLPAYVMKWYAIKQTGELVELPGEYVKETSGRSGTLMYKSGYEAIVRPQNQVGEYVCEAFTTRGPIQTCTLTLQTAKVSTGHYLNATLCAAPSVIEVHKVEDYHGTTCMVNLALSHPDQLQSIKQRCNGRKACEDLFVTERHLPDCGGTDPIISTHIELYYFCVDPLPNLTLQPKAVN